MTFTVPFNGFSILDGIMITPALAGFVLALPILLTLVSSVLAATKVISTSTALLYLVAYYLLGSNLDAVLPVGVPIEKFHMIFAAFCTLIYFPAGVAGLIIVVAFKIAARRDPNLAINLGYVPHILIISSLLGGLFGLNMPGMFLLLVLAQSIHAQVSWRPPDYFPL